MNNQLTPDLMKEVLAVMDGMAVLDNDGRYIYVSPGWESYTGWRAEDALGRFVCEVIPESHAPEVLRTGERVVSGLVTKNNTPAFTTYYPRFDARGNVCGVILLITLRGQEGPDGMEPYMALLSNQLEYYKQELSMVRGARYSMDNIIGESALMQNLRAQIKQAARNQSTVLIEGETGSGKELIAQSIHTHSRRAGGSFVRVNCAAIPPELMESEFFGYAAGAFTGALKKGKPGRFTLANGGSIFLDEVNLLPKTMQPKFLRVLQEREVDPVGGTDSIPVDVRVIAASNLNLERLVEQGEFRQDLFYRLNVIRITAPALRHRREDIPLLLNHFVQHFNRQLGMAVERVEEQAQQELMRHDWLGNVRELQNAVESAMNQATGTVLTRRHFAPFFERRRARLHANASARDGHFDLATEKRIFEKQLILEALKETNGARKAAAELLGISRAMLYQKLEQYGIV